MKLFIDQHNWKKISFPSHRKDWKKFELNNKSISINFLYLPLNREELRHTFISKHNSKCKSQPFLLLITNDKKWHYFVVKNLYALFRVITPSHIENSYCLN